MAIALANQYSLMWNQFAFWRISRKWQTAF